MQLHTVFNLQEWWKHFSFGQAKDSGDVIHICRGHKAADYPHKVWKYTSMFAHPVS